MPSGVLSKRRPHVAHVLGLTLYNLEIRWNRGLSGLAINYIGLETETYCFIEAVVSSTIPGAFIVDDVCRDIGVDAVGVDWGSGVAAAS